MIDLVYMSISPTDSVRVPLPYNSKDLLTKTGLRRECTALSLVIGLTGPEPDVISEMPSSQSKDDSSDIFGVQQGCGASTLKNCKLSGINISYSIFLPSLIHACSGLLMITIMVPQAVHA